MANIATLHVLLKAKDDLSAPMGKAQSKLERFTGAASKMKLPMLAAAAGFVALGAASVRAFAGFEQSMARAGALSGSTGAQLEQMTEVAKKMGRETQFSAKQAASALSFLSMAGFSVQESTAALPGVLQLAAAAQLDLGTAADITSNVLTGYGLKVSDLTRVNDVLAKAFTSANTDLTQLGEALKLAGPIASAAGIRFEEATAALALMGNAGIQASMAGTSLRGAITKLLNPAKEAGALLKKMGVEVTDSSGKMLPFVGIIKQLEDANLSAADAMTIFGQRAGPAMLALIGQGSAALEEFTAKLDTSGGTAERIAKQQMATLQGTLTRLSSAAEGLAIALGTLLAPVIEKVATALIGMTNLISGFLERMGKAPAVTDAATDSLKAFTNAANDLDDALGGAARSAGMLRKEQLEIQKLAISKQIKDLIDFATALTERPQRDRFQKEINQALDQAEALITQGKKLDSQIGEITSGLKEETAALLATGAAAGESGVQWEGLTRTIKSGTSALEKWREAQADPMLGLTAAIEASQARLDADAARVAGSEALRKLELKAIEASIKVSLALERDAQAQRQTMLNKDFRRASQVQTAITAEHAKWASERMRILLDEAQQRVRVNESIGRSFDDLTSRMQFNFSTQGTAWNQLGGTAESVLLAIQATTGVAASSIASDFALMRLEGESWKDLLLRLDKEGRINLASLAEGMDKLKEAARGAAIATAAISAGERGANAAGRRITDLIRDTANAQRAANIARGLPGGGFAALNPGQGFIPVTPGIVPRAHGGSVRAGQPVLVGERGMEVFRPNVSGTIIPNGGGGGTKILQLTVNYNAPSYESRDTVAQIWREVAEDGGFNEFISS